METNDYNSALRSAVTVLLRETLPASHRGHCTTNELEQAARRALERQRENPATYARDFPGLAAFDTPEALLAAIERGARMVMTAEAWNSEANAARALLGEVLPRARRGNYTAEELALAARRAQERQRDDPAGFSRDFPGLTACGTPEALLAAIERGARSVSSNNQGDALQSAVRAHLREFHPSGHRGDYTAAEIAQAARRAGERQREDPAGFNRDFPGLAAYGTPEAMLVAFQRGVRWVEGMESGNALVIAIRAHLLAALPRDRPRVRYTAAELALAVRHARERQRENPAAFARDYAVLAACDTPEAMLAAFQRGIGRVEFSDAAVESTMTAGGRERVENLLARSAAGVGASNCE